MPSSFRAASRSSPCRCISGSSPPNNSCVITKRRSSCSSLIPRIVANTRSGCFWAMVSMKSTSPSPGSSSNIAAALLLTISSRFVTPRGVKYPLATFRYDRCSGGSIVMMVFIWARGLPDPPSINDCICASLRTMIPPASLEKMSGWLDTSMMSSCFVIAQNGVWPRCAYQ